MFACDGLVIRKELLDKFLKTTKMKLIWLLQAEEQSYNEERERSYINKSLIGSYIYTGNDIIEKIITCKT